MTSTPSVAMAFVSAEAWRSGRMTSHCTRKPMSMPATIDKMIAGAMLMFSPSR